MSPNQESTPSEPITTVPEQAAPVQAVSEQQEAPISALPEWKDEPVATPEGPQFDAPVPVEHVPVETDASVDDVKANRMSYISPEGEPMRVQPLGPFAGEQSATANETIVAADVQPVTEPAAIKKGWFSKIFGNRTPGNAEKK